MGYPGDQQQPGGWASRQPPQSPYGPAEDQAAHGDSSSYGGPQDGSPYGDPRGGSPYGGAQGGSPYEESYDDPYGDRRVSPRHGRPPGASPYDAPREDTAYGAQQGGSSFDDSFGPGYDSGYDDSYGPEYGSGGPGGAHEGRRRSGGRRWLIIGAVVAGVVVVGGTVMALTSGGDSKTASPQTSVPATPTVNPTPSPTETGTGDRLQSRASDPTPLTLNEVFKTQKFKGSGRTYLMTTRRSVRTCSSGAHGTTFRKTLVKAGCTQVLRATFTNGKLIGTIGVLNLRSQAAAEAAQRASRPKDAFIIPLPGAGTTKKIGQGLSLTTAEADGHYLIMSWVQYPDGKKIAQSDYSAVSSFVRATTLGSNLRPALNYRSMEGKPS